MTTTSESLTHATIYGYPRQGRGGDFKRLIERYWNSLVGFDELVDGVARIRAFRLDELASSGLDELPSNDFSLYDHVLDTAFMLDALPSRHRIERVTTPQDRIDQYFAAARGTATQAPLEMTKWFDTNYHYLVPELGPGDEFTLDPTKPLLEFNEARSAGHLTRPVLLGPVSFLLLSRSTVEGFNPLELIDRILPCYLELLSLLKKAGAPWVQLDEPSLVCDQPTAVLELVERVYEEIGTATERSSLLVASYFDRLGDALPVLARAPIEGLAIDFTDRAVANLDAIKGLGGIGDKRLIAGVVSGRNIWRSDLDKALSILEELREICGNVDVAASSSLIHVPIDVTLETDMDPVISSWLSFAFQKLGELVTLARGMNDGREHLATELKANKVLLSSRRSSPIVHDELVQRRLADLAATPLPHRPNYGLRSPIQQERLSLPLLPTTTIGSFPQTHEIRLARADLAAGRIDQAAYRSAMQEEIARVVELQTALELDVLVHGEPERNDMVQYFAEQLKGFLAHQHGWVQSYGTRLVRPPIIVGDVSRPKAMTVEWARYAQSLTDRPMKGMLTGPITMLAWSFVRDDQPLGDTARQVALALRDEVLDLEQNGITIIQVDEPALRESLPLRKDDRRDYLAWAVEAFQITTSAVQDSTQIHTHMCYADFGDVLDAIIAMDADVISLEAARSNMEIVADLARAGYPNAVGPGLWDIHSPRVPSSQEIRDRILLTLERLPIEAVWANPDCGLKTRGYDETKESLANLIEAVRSVRATR